MMRLRQHGIIKVAYRQLFLQGLYGGHGGELAQHLLNPVLHLYQLLFAWSKQQWF
jgi:hypothetical protein